MLRHFVTLSAYNRWANARLYADALALGDALYRKDVGAYFGSLRGTLNHLLVADRIWMRRFTGEGECPDRLDAILCDGLPALQSAREAEDARISAYVGSITATGLERNVTFAAADGAAQTFPLRDLLAHFFSHQTHHRGQAHGILTSLGMREPRQLNLFAMMREAT